MDVLVNGDEDEKMEFSFRLIDISESGVVDFEQFRYYFNRVITHWSTLVNSHVRLAPDLLQNIFNEIDTKRCGKITFDEYRAALEKNPDLLDWFKILN